MIRRLKLGAAPAAVVLLGALAVATSACGRQAPLERPAPLFGEKAKADYREQQAARRQSSQDRTAQRNANTPAADQADPSKTDSTTTRRLTDDSDENTELNKRDIRDPSLRLSPLSSSPVPGVPDPVGAPVSVTPPN